MSDRLRGRSRRPAGSRRKAASGVARPLRSCRGGRPLSSSSSSGDGLSFEALQRRASSGGRTVQQLAATMHAHFIAFDVLQKDDQELLNQRYERRRAVLEDLFAEHGLTPPWTLCPMTTDPAVAQD
ncbi:hypothetical protein ABT010_34585 [Streptomyces sp. NPDC002668]|uniref:ATP-dependent DNA ligase n=1 Tax=Streptomyces sp. NPDC002668 TaxID=3154422 RepID=UPI00333078E0